MASNVHMTAKQKGEMRTIAIVNQKGGSGKTTTAVNLAATLAGRGRQVLLLDLDPQYSATTWFALPNPGRGIFEVFANPHQVWLQDLIRPTPVDNVCLVPSSAWLVGAEKALSSEPGAETILRDKMRHLGTLSFHYLFIDCPPNLTVLTVNALTAVREVLVPVECHVMGLQGLAQLLQTVDLVRQRLNPTLDITGLLPCRFDVRTRHGQEIVAQLRTRFPDKTFQTVIRENVRLAECPSMGVPITDYAPNCPGSEDYRALALEVIRQEKTCHAENNTL
jgi:chromosome partitioning protein